MPTTPRQPEHQVLRRAFSSRFPTEKARKPFSRPSHLLPYVIEGSVIGGSYENVSAISHPGPRGNPCIRTVQTSPGGRHRNPRSHRSEHSDETVGRSHILCYGERRCSRPLGRGDNSPRFARSASGGGGRRRQRCCVGPALGDDEWSQIPTCRRHP